MNNKTTYTVLTILSALGLIALLAFFKGAGTSTWNLVFMGIFTIGLAYFLYQYFLSMKEENEK